MKILEKRDNTGKISIPPGSDPQEENLEKLLELLTVKLQERARNLRLLGFPVDDECRIMPEVRPGASSEDIDAAFEHRLSASMEDKKIFSREKIIGELWEQAAVILLNEHWLKKKFIAIRTSRFDDERGHKIDLLLFDVESKDLCIAIDCTTNIKKKLEGRESPMDRWKNGAMVRHNTQKEQNIRMPFAFLVCESKGVVELSEALLREKINIEVINKIEQKGSGVGLFAGSSISHQLIEQVKTTKEQTRIRKDAEGSLLHQKCRKFLQKMIG